MSFPVVQVEGPPFERGRQYGDEAAGRVHRSLEIYWGAFRERGLSEQRVHELATDFLGVIGERDPAAAEEMRGIADGAGLTVQDIVALNARTELLFWQDDGCTAVACTPEVTKSGHTLVAQNWDWKPECAESTVILHAVCEDGVEFITLAEAGTLARSGMSSTGIAVAGNFLASDQDFGRSGIPIPFIRRAILRSGSIDEALELIASAPRAFSSNHLVADASGRVVDCETSPESTFLLHPADGLLAHSNHFCSPEATKQLTDTGIARYPDTLHRHTSARARLEESAPEVTPEDVKDALSDHHGHPHSVCRHLSDPPAEGEIVTVASIVMDVTAGHMWVSDGRPCEQGYEEYSLISKGHADAR